MASVLVVDDEPDMQHLVAATLRVRASEFEVVAVANDGHEAIALWRATRPDVVVLDHRMPDLTGLEVAERILAEDPRQCIVIFSAYVTADLETRAAALGVRQCVGKDRICELPGLLTRACAA